MVKIVTRHTSNAAGRGQVIAKGGGRQRTISWDHSVSAERNHGNAAGTLAIVLLSSGMSGTGDEHHANFAAAAERATHTTNDDGSHTFTI